jgi:hypothetical protein
MHQFLVLVRGVFPILLDLKLQVLHYFRQRSEFLAQLLVLFLELAYLFHEGQQLLRELIGLLEHPSFGLQLREDRSRFRLQAIDLDLILIDLLLQAAHFVETLLDGGYIVGARPEVGLRCSRFLHRPHLRL